MRISNCLARGLHQLAHPSRDRFITHHNVSRRQDKRAELIVGRLNRSSVAELRE